jgi:multidrug efflux pump
VPLLADVASATRRPRGLQASLVIDRATAARHGRHPDMIDRTLGNAFGVSWLSTIYTDRNQYRVCRWKSTRATRRARRR